MRYLRKLLRWFLIPLGVFFVVFNLGSYLVLNIPAIQRMIVSDLNQKYFEQQGYALSLQSLSLSLIPIKLNLNGLEIRQVGDTRPSIGPAEGTTPHEGDDTIRVARLSLGLRLVKTYVTRRVVFGSLDVEGLHLKIAPSDKPSEFNIEDVEKFLFIRKMSLHDRLRQFIPESTVISDLTLDALTKDGEGAQHFHFAKLEVEAPSRSKDDIQIGAQLDSYVLFLAPDRNQVNLSSVSIKAALTEKDVLEVKQLDLEGNIGKLSFNGALNIERKLLNSNYSLHADATILSAPSLGMARLTGSGWVHLVGVVGSSKLGEPPSFRGKANWRDMVIEGFSAYNGSADVTFEKMTIFGNKLEISTPLGASIKGKVEFELFGPVKFRGTVAIEEWHFLELMKGLGAPNKVLDFKVNADKVDVNGQIIGNKEKDFFIKITTSARLSDLLVPDSTFGKNGYRLPDCSAELQLYADTKELNVGDSTARCGRADNKISVTKGLLLFDGNRADFRLNGVNTDLHAVSYFLGLPTAGNAETLKGRITSSNRDPVKFEGDLESKNVTLFGFQFETLAGHLELRPDGVEGESIEGVLKDYKTAIHLQHTYVRFKDLYSEFKGSLGERFSLSSVVDAGYLPPDFPSSDAKIYKAYIDLNGPLFQPWHWNLHSSIALQSVRLGTISARVFEARASCENGVCRDSKVQIGGLAGKKTKEIPGSFAVFDIGEMSFDNVKLSGALLHVPAEVLSLNSKVAIEGKLDGRIDMHGAWKTWAGSVRLTGDSFGVNGTDFGLVTLNARAETAGILNIFVDGRYNQIQLRIKTSCSLSGESSIFARVSGFDVSSFFDEETRVRLNLIGRVSGELLLSGKAPLTSGLGEMPWYKTWKMTGSLSRFDMQTNQFAYQLVHPVKLLFVGQVLKTEKVVLRSGTQVIEASFDVDFEKQHVGGKIDGNINLAVTQVFWSRIAAAEGDVELHLKLSGDFSKVSVAGTLHVDGKLLSLKDWSPAVTDIKSDMILEDGKLEIREFRAKKGTGILDIAGSLSWEDMQNGKSDVPSVALRGTASGIQWRMPARVFGFIDSTLSGNISVLGSSLPYTVSGNITVQRLLASRDVSCRDVVDDLMRRRALEQEALEKASAVLNVSVISDRSIYIQTECMRSRMSADLKFSGPANAFSISGEARAESGFITYQKRRFDIKKWEMYFENPVKIDPRVDIQVTSEISNYKVNANATGTLTNLKFDIWSDPDTFPTGEPLERQDILRMISSGQVPQKSTGTQGSGYVIATSAADYLITPFDDSLSETVAMLTGGFIDNIQVRPIIDDTGQNKLKARATKSIGDRFNLSLDVDLGPTSTSNTQSLRTNFLLNDTVNFQGELERTTGETSSPTQLLGGIHFQFGSE